MSESDQPAASETQRPLPASNLERLWTPWRMQYVGSGPAEEGCVFCNRLAGDDDVDSLILYRGKNAFLIMNLFPYNTGHLMIVPNQHVASPEDLDDETQFEMALLVPIVLRAVRRALNPGGFNVGMNLGWVAGAGIAAHMHQHVVPRWSGDANFMPILANTKVLPELILVTYAKIRVEIEREISNHAGDVTLIALDLERNSILVDAITGNGALHLPRFSASSDEAIWKTAANTLETLGIQGYTAGWAGSRRANSDEPIGLLVLTQGSVNPENDARFVPLESVRSSEQSLLDLPDLRLLNNTLDHLNLDK
jgi:ATP adenylyltransferase